MFVQDVAVPKMTLCVTFFGRRCGAKTRPICTRSDYVTFSTIAAIAVREMTVCVAFGVPHLGFLQRLGDTQPSTKSAVFCSDPDFGICGLELALGFCLWRISLSEMVDTFGMR